MIKRKDFYIGVFLIINAISILAIFFSENNMLWDSAWERIAYCLFQDQGINILILLASFIPLMYWIAKKEA